MEDYQLGVVESRFADLVWEREPLTTRELAQLCGERLHWKRTTTYSVLKKLCEKGLFKLENRMVTALVSRAEYQAYRSERFVAEAFQGSLPAFVLAFGSRRKLSQEEVEELQKIIDSFQE